MTTHCNLIPAASHNGEEAEWTHKLVLLTLTMHEGQTAQHLVTDDFYCCLWKLFCPEHSKNRLNV